MHTLPLSAGNTQETFADGSNNSDVMGDQMYSSFYTKALRRAGAIDVLFGLLIVAFTSLAGSNSTAAALALASLAAFVITTLVIGVMFVARVFSFSKRPR